MPPAYLKSAAPIIASVFRSCNKAAFVTMKEARTVLRRSGDAVAAAYVYKCPRCEAFHLTAQKERGDKPSATRRAKIKDTLIRKEVRV